MNDGKKISPIGNGVPTRETEINRKNSITDNSENINSILEKLAETLKLTRQCSDVVRIRKINDVAVIDHIDGSIDCVNIACDSGIAAIYDIVKKIIK